MKKSTLTVLFVTIIIFSLIKPLAALGANTNITKDVLFSGLSYKFGWMTSPKVKDFGDKWIAAISWDKGISPYLSWGLECQPYLRSYKSTDFKASSITGNLFVNAKGGYPVGQLIKIKALRFLKPIKVYSGLGFGLEISNTSVNLDGDSYNDLSLHFAWHMIFGIQYSLPKITFMMEIQPVRVIDKNLDPSTVKTNYILFGIRF